MINELFIASMVYSDVLCIKFVKKKDDLWGK